MASLYCRAMPESDTPPPPASDDHPAPAEAATTPPSGAAPPVANAGHSSPRPDGEPADVVALRGLVEAKLTEMVESYGVDQHGNYVLGLSSARVFIVPTWLENGMTVVRVFAITNLDVPVTAGLSSYLLTKNLEFVFGAFALDVKNGAVWFNHNLLGQHVTPEELETTLGAVAETANQFDDEIKSQFGGRLYVEGPGEAVPTPATPGYL